MCVVRVSGGGGVVRCSPVVGPGVGVVMAGLLAHHLQAVEGSHGQRCVTSWHGKELRFSTRLGESMGVRCAGQTPATGTAGPPGG
jgi:hypothetical protein